MDQADAASAKSFTENSTVKAEVVIKALILLMSEFITTSHRKSDRPLNPTISRGNKNI
ncbi:hypothetical protein [Nostoc sp.]|uniref:hypothetical protein n=1 Tax=Nostoc sp. TaxID=1180 RepID=UPI002FF7F16C